jgi:hypothetical protein
VKTVRRLRTTITRSSGSSRRKTTTIHHRHSRDRKPSSNGQTASPPKQ